MRLQNLMRKKICSVILISVFTATMFSPVFASEYTTLPGGSPTLKMLEPGEEAVDFVIKTLDGDDYKLSDTIGDKIILLLFWSIFCQPCQEEIPIIKDLYNKVGKDVMTVLAVSLDGEKRIPAIRKYIKQNKLDFVFLMDVFSDDASSFVASDTYGVLGTPTFYIIDKKGIITNNHTGKSTLKDLLKKISDAKAGS